MARAQPVFLRVITRMCVCEQFTNRHCSLLICLASQLRDAGSTHVVCERRPLISSVLLQNKQGTSLICERKSNLSILSFCTLGANNTRRLDANEPTPINTICNFPTYLYQVDKNYEFDGALLFVYNLVRAPF